MSFFYVCIILVFVENKSGSKILFIIYFQKFNFHRLHTKDHQWSSSPFNFISANTCPVESTDKHLQRICAFFQIQFLEFLLAQNLIWTRAIPSDENNSLKVEDIY